MKKYKVQAGKHRFKPLQLGLYKEKSSLVYEVKFDSSCAYDLQDGDQDDINKLFGIGFLSFNWAPHHIDSARFGWNYSKLTEKIHIYSYCYIDGKVKYDFYNPICVCEFNKSYIFYLGISLDKYNFVVWKKEDILNEGYEAIPFNHNKKWSFLLSPFFGGNEKAPNNMVIYMDKK